MKKDTRHTNLLFRLFFKLKYTFLGKLMPEPRLEDAQRGLLLIQVDGLSYTAVLKAMEKGYVPAIKKLVNKKGYRLLPYHCPMPSNTPYVQAGIMYGNNDGVIGFRWMEKDAGKRVTFKEAASAALVEERVSKGRIGILTGGSSYLNLFTGGAERSVFTLSTFASGNILKKKKISQFDIFILFIAYITNLLRTIIYIFVDLFLEFFEWLYLFTFRKKRRGEGIFPLIRLVNNVIFREVETAGAMTDIVRGVPAVHLTFNGYDEMAHHRGAHFSGAFRTLRGIDRKIRKILRAVDSCMVRDYDVYIFSDHGQTPSSPFMYLYGETMAELVQRTTSDDLEVTEFNSPQEVVLYEGWKYMREFAFLTLNLPRFIYNAFERLRAKLLRDRPQIVPFVWEEKREQVFVHDSGPLSHIYFNFSKEKIATDEIEKRHPGFIAALLEHPGIGTLIGRDEKGKGVVFKWDEGLGNATRESFMSLAEEKYAGDIIVQGKYADGEIVNFEEQLSAHGGVGGDQNRPFFLSPPECGPDLSLIRNPRDFYPFFYENYTKRFKAGD